LQQECLSTQGVGLHLEHMNSITSACGVPLDVSTSSVSIGAAITLSWKVGKGIISTTIQSRSRWFKHKWRQRWENFINLQKRWK